LLPNFFFSHLKSFHSQSFIPYVFVHRRNKNVLFCAIGAVFAFANPPLNVSLAKDHQKQQENTSPPPKEESSHEAPAIKEPWSEKQKIHFLLEEIEASDLIFVRNGVEYNGRAAAKHFRFKLKCAGPIITTVDRFIIYIGSKSTLTRRNYLVKYPDGKTVEARNWLREKLKEMETHHRK